MKKENTKDILTVYDFNIAPVYSDTSEEHFPKMTGRSMSHS